MCTTDEGLIIEDNNTGGVDNGGTPNAGNDGGNNNGGDNGDNEEEDPPRPKPLTGTIGL